MTIIVYLNLNIDNYLVVATCCLNNFEIDIYITMAECCLDCIFLDRSGPV